MKARRRRRLARERVFDGRFRSLVLGPNDSEKTNLNMARKEVEEAVDKIVTGTGIDFGKRLARL